MVLISIFQKKYLSVFQIRGLKHSPLLRLFIKLELIITDVACSAELALSDSHDLTAACPFLELGFAFDLWLRVNRNHLSG